MKKEFNKKLLFLLLLLVPLITITVYMTYAFYVGEIEGNEQVSTIAVQGGNILINYQGDSGNIVASNIFPGWESTKTFTVSCSINYLNKSTVKIVWYDMILVIDQNTFENNSIEYSLQISDADKTKEGIFTEEEYNGIPKGTSSITMGSGYLLNETTTHTYNLKLRYTDSDEIDQTIEANARFNARVNVAGSKQTTLTIDFGELVSNGKFALSSGPTYKVAANSKVYIPSTHFYSEVYQFTYLEKVGGDGSASGNVVSTTSENISVKANYIVPPFSTDSWATIAENIKSGNVSRYRVGDTREIAIDGFTNTESGSNGLYTVRVANNSTPSECRTSGFSQTACGFVIEFVDIITTYNMNPAGTYNGTEYPYGTNVGGWPSSSMRDYIKNTLLGKLPNDLQSVMIDTAVVSGHGSADTGTRSDGNWESIDKLYLLSIGEINSTCLANDCWDTASYPYNGNGATTTRQLDYYNGYALDNNFDKAIKTMNGNSMWWWLRGAIPAHNNDFKNVNIDGLFETSDSKNIGGIAPAFRIG